MKVIIEIETTDHATIIEASNMIGLISSLADMAKQCEGMDKDKTKVGAEPKETPTKPKVSPKPKKTPTKPLEKIEEPKVEPKVEAKEGITLANLKDRAKDKAQSAGRDTVKAVIGKYAPKLTEVSPEDYGKLYKTLGEL